MQLLKSIKQDSPGIADEQLRQVAKQNNYIIVAFDKDYVELLFRYSLQNREAIIYFREKECSDCLLAKFYRY